MAKRPKLNDDSSDSSDDETDVQPVNPVTLMQNLLEGERFFKGMGRPDLSSKAKELFLEVKHVRNNNMLQPNIKEFFK